MILIVSQTLLWVVVFALACAVLALARQVGVLHSRISPVGALSIGRGPQPGDAAPDIKASVLSGDSIRLGGASPSSRLLFFVSATCPICKTLIPTVQSVARVEKLDLIFVGDGEEPELHSLASRFKIEPSQFAVSAAAGRALQVGKLPYAVLIDHLGIIAAQGLVNTREHVESLASAHEMRLPSVQAFMRQARTSAAPNDDEVR